MANDTGLRDEHYDIVSVLYHPTHGAWNYEQYISDAEKAGDDELAQFFRERSSRTPIWAGRQLTRAVRSFFARCGAADGAHRVGVPTGRDEIGQDLLRVRVEEQPAEDGVHAAEGREPVVRVCAHVGGDV